MHTPGRWTVTELDPAPSPGFAYGVGHDPLDDSEIPWPVALVTTPDDAHLVAAAPTMLARLENILADCETWQDNATFNSDVMGDLICQIVAECHDAIGVARTGLPDTLAEAKGE